MKKLIFSLMVFSVVCVYAQEFQWPGFRCRDVEIIQTQLALAPDKSWYKYYLTYMLDFAQNGEPENLTAAAARIEAAAKLINSDVSDTWLLTLVKQYALQNGVFPDELVAFCKTHPSTYDLLVALRYGDDDWRFDIFSRVLLEGKRSAKDTGRALEAVNDLSVKLGKDNATMYSLLSDCNRIYTGKLLKDKEAWADIVAQIRTLMDVYK